MLVLLIAFGISIYFVRRHYLQLLKKEIKKEDMLQQGNHSSVLGLSICRAIVEMLGGEFYMDTAYDKKTVASFWFPCEMKDTHKNVIAL